MSVQMFVPNLVCVCIHIYIYRVRLAKVYNARLLNPQICEALLVSQCFEPC